MRPCRFLRCQGEAVYVAASPGGDLVDLCPDDAADGVERGRYRWIVEGEAAWPRPEGIERDGDFLEIAS